MNDALQKKDKAWFSLNKRGNEYAAALGNDYNLMPKAVLAAIAVSLAVRVNGEEDFAAARELVVSEWEALYRNGIVTQKSPLTKSTEVGSEDGV